MLSYLMSHIIKIANLVVSTLHGSMVMAICFIPFTQSTFLKLEILLPLPVDSLFQNLFLSLTLNTLSSLFLGQLSKISIASSLSINRTRSILWEVAFRLR